MKMKRVISIGVLAVFLSTAMFQTSYAAPSDTQNENNKETNNSLAEVNNKSEVVYGTMTANGSAKALYVVNHFELDNPGNITDYGDYDSVQNLTDLGEITKTGDTITFETEAKDFYYQGNMDSTELPWIFNITYSLNGVKMSPSDIAGKDGKLEISIKIEQNKKVDPAFYENYMLQISITLNNEKCSNIIAPDGTIADAGNNKMLNFTVMQNKNADYKVTADVNDFTMSGMELSAIPFSINMDLPDTDSMLEDFEKLPNAISELNNGVGKLADGTIELKKGSTELKSGSGDIKNGLTELKKNSSSITTASAQINSALKEISSGINNNSGGTSLTQLAQLPEALKQLSSGLKSISSGLTELKNGYSTAYTALDASIKGIPDVTITKSQLDQEFPDMDNDQRKLLNDLYNSYLANQTVKTTYDQVNIAFASIAPTIQTLTGNIDTISTSIDTMAAAMGSSESGEDITKQLGQLAEGLTTLSTNYSTFDQGLKEYMSGVGKLSDGYDEFDSGLTEFKNGVGTLNSGVTELYDGTGKLNEEVSKMPDMMQEEVDKLTADYVGSEFQPISFVSSKNTNTDLVQFVLKCEGIKVSDNSIALKDTSVSEDVKKEETVFDRFVALFK